MTAVVPAPAGDVVGLVEGRDAPVEVFRGIPYAQPPVGDLRWRAPEPLAPWGGTLQAVAFGPQCVQGNGGGNSSEDCLYLNIWRPTGAIAEPLPVMVWIHGGSYTNGDGGLRFYAGTNFAQRDRIAITINYRLGPLGFLAHPALSAENDRNVSGNYGLLDMIAALQWVQDNIAAFGGDPGNVTIFGESAGSMAVSNLLVSPLAEGLFHRAIMQSGVQPRVDPLREAPEPARAAEEDGLAFAAQAGIEGAGPDAAAALRALSPREIQDVDLDDIEGDPLILDWQPVVDGWALPGQPLLLVQRGDYNRVPILAGTNADEGGLFVPLGRLSSDEYIEFANESLGVFADDLLEVFPPLDGNNRAQAAQVVTDYVFLTHTRMLVRAAAQWQDEVYYYFFTRRPAGAIGSFIGPVHAVEIPYVFGTLPGLPQFAPVDQMVSQAMQSYWAAFAANGDPNTGELMAWPAYDALSDLHLEFGDDIFVSSSLREEEADAITPIVQAGLEE